MLGFGCVFGEIMIVLMVMGNMFIVDWDLFVGLCVFIVNFVIELFEVELDSMYYKVLFLMVCVLFIFIFVVNMLVELLCQCLCRNVSYG